MPVFLRAEVSRAHGASSVLRSKTLKSAEFSSDDLSENAGTPRKRAFVGANWRDNPAAIQNFGYTED